MNPRLNLHDNRQTWFNNRRRNLFKFCQVIIPSSLTPLCDGLGPFWPWLVAPVWHGAPAEPCTRRGKDKGRRISYLLGSAVNYLPSPAQIQKKIRIQKGRIFYITDVPKLPKEVKLANNPKITWKKIPKLIDETNLLHSEQWRLISMVSWGLSRPYSWCNTGNTHVRSGAVDPASK